MVGDKKFSIIAILKILQEKSDVDHPLTYDKIVELLQLEYGLSLERRAVSRNIQILNDFGYDIEVGRKGAFIHTREFDDPELKLLIDNILSNKYITQKHTKQLIDKLMHQTSLELKKHTKYVCASDEWSKTTNEEVFLNVELIDEAIANKKQIEFDYNAYNTMHQLVPRHKDKKSIVSPYRMVVKNQRYYLMSKNMERGTLTYYKIDKITNMKILDKCADDINTLPSFTHGVNNMVLSDALPYMFSDKPENIQIELKTPETADAICDWFGHRVKFMTGKDNRIIACVKSSPLAMKYWALQYVDVAKIISPSHLVNDVKRELQLGLDYYNL